MIITFPWPAKELNPNNRSHYQKKAKIKAVQRLECNIITKNTKHASRGLTPLKITFHPPDKRRRDLDNLLSSCKGMLDGMAEAMDLDDRYFRPITIDFGDIVKKGEVTIELA